MDLQKLDELGKAVSKILSMSKIDGGVTVSKLGNKPGIIISLQSPKEVAIVKQLFGLREKGSTSIAPARGKIFFVPVAKTIKKIEQSIKGEGGTKEKKKPSAITSPTPKQESKNPAPVAKKKETSLEKSGRKLAPRGIGEFRKGLGSHLILHPEDKHVFEDILAVLRGGGLKAQNLRDFCEAGFPESPLTPSLLRKMLGAS